MRLSDFIRESKRAKSVESVLALMERAASDLGFDRYAYSALTGHERYEACGNPPPTVAHNYPEAWHAYYFAHDYQHIDPVITLAPDIEQPFLWDSLNDAYDLDRAQLKVLREARESGLRDGVGVPLHGPRGSVCLVTFAASEGHPDPGPKLPMLDVLAAQFHSAYSVVGRTEEKRDRGLLLSLRERECLQWIARGKTSGDVGIILQISEHTVNYHVKNALHKLDVNTRILAVVRAIRYGLISA